MKLQLALGLGLSRARGGGASHPIIAKDSLGNIIEPLLHDGYEYIVFKTSGTLQVIEPTEVDYLLVAGGGGGGGHRNEYNCAGGAGAASYAVGTKSIFPGSSDILIGSGGKGGRCCIDSAPLNNGGQGGTTLALDVSVIGGIGSPGWEGLNGSAGVCGSGATTPGSGTRIGGSGSVGGNGGNSIYIGNLDRAAGGGGGIAGSGISGASRKGGDGGVGIRLSDIWNDINELDCTEIGIPYEYCGGGGGSVRDANGVNGNGVYGGGNGVNSLSIIRASDATPNTGSGGGGAGHFVTEDIVYAGTGGSGICIIRRRVA